MKLIHLKEAAINFSVGDIVIVKDNRGIKERYKVTKTGIKTKGHSRGEEFLGNRWIKTRKTWSKQEHLIPISAVVSKEK